MTTKEQIAVMQHFENGEEVEWSLQGSRIWHGSLTPKWNWESKEYRVKEIPKKKEVVIIEKVLVRDEICSWVLEGNRDYLNHMIGGHIFKVKTIDTYEIEL